MGKGDVEKPLLFVQNKKSSSFILFCLFNGCRTVISLMIYENVCILWKEITFSKPYCVSTRQLHTFFDIYICLFPLMFALEICDV